MAKIHAKIIINPAAGSNSTHRKWPLISRALKYFGLSFDYQHTEGVGHAIELAREAMGKGYRFLVAVGGDGTINEVANGIMGFTVTDGADLGMVHTGTGSDFVRSLGIPRDYHGACSTLAEQHKRLIDVGVVSLGENGNKRFFVNAAGLGFDAEVVEARSKMPRYFRGTVPYLLGMGRKLLGYHNKEVIVEIDGRRQQEKVLSVVVANGGYFGGGMHVAPNADLQDNLFDVLTIGDVGKFELVKALPTIYKGTHINHPKVKVERASHIRVESDEKLLVQVDGELVGEGPAVFSMLPQALSVVV